MLDSFAGPDDAIASIYDRWRRATAELEDLERTAQENPSRRSLWSFQRNEIEFTVAPLPNEDAELKTNAASCAMGERSRNPPTPPTPPCTTPKKAPPRNCKLVSEKVRRIWSPH